MSAVDMLGCHPAAAAIGITGDVALASQEGPFCELALTGRFWHQRATVLRRAEAHLRARIPRAHRGDCRRPGVLLDAELDEMTGVVLADHRAPDYNGDRATLEYQGIDPDDEAPARSAVRPGGSTGMAEARAGRPAQASSARAPKELGTVPGGKAGSCYAQGIAEKDATRYRRRGASRRSTRCTARTRRPRPSPGGCHSRSGRSAAAARRRRPS